VEKSKGIIVFVNMFKATLFSWVFLFSLPAESQQLPPKEIKETVQFWTSINVNARVAERWNILADFHVRRTNFIKDPGFYLIRTAMAHQFNPNLSLAAGYAHLWLATEKRELGFYANENRLFEQLIYTHPAGKTKMLHRIRNEQRWIEAIKDAEPTGNFQFTNRIRYLFSARIPVFENPKLPQLLIADEIMFHFGKPVVHSNFEQNRIFAGINQPISREVSFDFGYMFIYQLRVSGYQYTANHVIRLFFYYTPDWRKKNSGKSNIQKDHVDD
jgi:hypothetical protein